MKFKAIFANRKTDYSVPLTELEEGQIGQITADNDPLSNKDCKGRFVQWSAGEEDGGYRLREVGRVKFWQCVDKDKPETQAGYRVRILGEGDRLAVGKDGRITAEWAARDSTVPMSALQPGEIGEVATEGYKGQLVARAYRGFQDGAVQYLDGTNAWSADTVRNGTLRVRILKPGDRIEIVNDADDADDADDGVEGTEG